MSYDKTVSDHYSHGSLLAAIEGAVVKMGKTSDTVTIDDLAAIDEFHIGGRPATDHLLEQLGFSEQDQVLDVGCGLGGASRFVASNCGNRVTGIDLTQEYVDVGNALCGWVGLDAQVSLHQGSALSMPFEAERFDGAYMLHVGMNIEDKTALFKEVYRVLRPGASFGVYDVMRLREGELSYPVPWAMDKSTCKLAPPAHYQEALTQAGFQIVKEDVRHEFALEFFQKLRAKTAAAGGPPPLSLHTLMQESTAVKLNNMVHNIQAGLIAPVEIIAQKV